MENVTKLLDEVKTRAGVETDYALAKTLELPTQRISDYYKGRRAPDEFACLQIATILGKTLDEVITAVKLDTVKNEKRRLAWRQHYKSIGGLAASFMLVAFAFVTMIVTSPSEAAQTQGVKRGIDHPTNYANYRNWIRNCAAYAKNLLSACLLLRLAR